MNTSSVLLDYKMLLFFSFVLLIDGGQSFVAAKMQQIATDSLLTSIILVY